jgi:hypothetical protein
MDQQTLPAALPETIAQMCDPDIEWSNDPRRGGPVLALLRLTCCYGPR